MTLVSGSERRRFSRVRFDTAATLAQEGSAYHAHLLDISLNGVLVETPDNYEFRADKPVDLSIILSDEAEIQMQVALVHSSSDYLGFRCESIDVDSIAHLRRLIELNLDDPAASERVLSELVADS